MYSFTKYRRQDEYPDDWPKVHNYFMCMTTSWFTCLLTAVTRPYLVTSWRCSFIFVGEQNSVRSKAKSSTGGLCCRNRATHPMDKRNYPNNSTLHSRSQCCSINFPHLPKYKSSLLFFRPAFIGALHHPLSIIHFLLYCPPCFITVSLMLYEINFARLQKAVKRWNIIDISPPL